MLQSGALKLILASTAVASVAFILYGPVVRKRKRKKGTCVGLVNLGNTCFMNAVLQALAPCHSVHDWLHTVLLNTGESNPWLAYALHNVWKVLNNRSKEATDTEAYSPAEILDALRVHSWQISSDEQDAHELFHVFTETLDEESAKYPAILSLLDVKALQDKEIEYQSDKCARNRIGTRLPVLPARLQHPFRGLLASQLQCTVCGHKNPVRYDTFDSLSLMIPRQISTWLNLDNLLQHYIAPERVDRVDCDGCQKRKKTELKPKTTFVKTLTIGKLPQCLCIHIQRTIWLDNGMPMKTRAPVNYPQFLTMSPYIYTNHVSRQERLHKTLAGLIGGNTSMPTTKQNQTTHPSIAHTKVRQPYPKPVVELKARHYTDKYYSPGIGFTSDDQQTNLSTIQNTNANDPSNPQAAPKLNLMQLFGAPKNSYSTPDVYKLMSVVEHYGDISSGHFVTYRRGPSNHGNAPEHWLFTSDTSVRKVPRYEALNSEAYMLYYERCSESNS